MAENPSIYQALALAKLDFGKVVRKEEVSAGSYSYKYATLDDMISATQDALAKQGLVVAHTSEIKEGGVEIVATLYGWGGTLSAAVTLPLAPSGGKLNAAQLFGGVLTYGRRYSYAALLGIAVEDDLDAAHMDYKAPEPSAKAPRTAPPAKAEGKPVESAATALSQLIKESVEGGKITKELGAKLWTDAKSIKNLAEATMGAVPDFAPVVNELNKALEDFAEKAANPDLF